MTTVDGDLLDRSDPLAPIRALFDLPEGVVYLDGNSLGPPLRSVRARVAATLEEWGADLIAGWFQRGWVDLPARVGARIGGIVGAEPDSVVACDSTSVNLFKALDAACSLRKGVLLTDTGNFPTDLYILTALARRQERTCRVVEPQALVDSLTPEVAVVALTQVDFKTGRLHDLRRLSARAAETDTIVVCDLSHSAGVMPIGLAETGVGLAVGCGYKYLNGGPGAPGYLYVSPSVQEMAGNPLTGWFGHEDPFRFSPRYQPAAGVGRMQVGTPNVLSLVALDEALTAFAGVDLKEVRRKSLGLTSTFIEMIDAMFGDQVEIVTPRQQAERGSQVTLRHPRAGPVVEALARKGVVGDYRPPDLIRFGFAPLFNSYKDSCIAATTLEAVLEEALS
ncbi:MAG: kynureninase [Acidimicrobiia bacterium]